MKSAISHLALTGALAAILMGTPARAEILTFKADLKGASETPPTDSAGSAKALVSIDTTKKEVTWSIQYSGLTGDPTAAHFHGPAAVGEKAGPEIDISGKIESGSSPLTDAQLADFQAGKVYLNIHTAKFPDGEIRGQVEK
jgi:hypothetical protein